MSSRNDESSSGTDAARGRMNGAKQTGPFGPVAVLPLRMSAGGPAGMRKAGGEIPPPLSWGRKMRVIRSMTGYGRSQQQLNGWDITVEIKSVNHRYFEFSCRTPRNCAFLEDKLKAQVQSRISRGKVDVFISIDSTGADEEVVAVNEGLARSYLAAFDKLCALDVGKHLNAKCDVTDFARIPDVLTVTKAEEDLESLGADICEVLDEALAAYNEMRATEGRKLAEDIGGGYDVIVANIVADVIIGMSPMFADKLVKGGTLICSGILNERAEEVRAALEKSGFTILSHEKSDDWSAFAAKK